MQIQIVTIQLTADGQASAPPLSPHFRWHSPAPWLPIGMLIACLAYIMFSDTSTMAGEHTVQDKQHWVEALHPHGQVPASLSMTAEHSPSEHFGLFAHQFGARQEERIAAVKIHSVVGSDRSHHTTDSFTVIGDIYTDNGRTEYGDDIATVLDQVKQIIRYAEHSIIQLEAHCDDRQSSAYSLMIGEQRARGLAAVLQNIDVDDTRLRVVSYGHERPACGQGTIDCWEDNLRMQRMFRTLAFQEPQNGCFVRMTVQDREDLVHYLQSTPASAFLKKIHLAEPAGRRIMVGSHPLIH